MKYNKRHSRPTQVVCAQLYFRQWADLDKKNADEGHSEAVLAGLLSWYPVM